MNRYVYRRYISGSTICNFSLWYRLDFTMNNSTKELANRFSQCYTFFRSKDENAENVILTAIHASLIPLIIGANLFSIFGIIKIKRNKFTASQILFLTLFVNDLTVGVVQLPMTLYLRWKPSYPTCLEIQIGLVLLSFPTHMSAILLSAISVERYLSVAHNRCYKSIATKKVLTLTVILATVISTVWSLVTALYDTDQDATKKAKLYFSGSAYAAILLGIDIILNVSLLRNVKGRIKNSAVHQVLDSSLTKTISIILAVLVVTYVPFLIVLSITAYMFIGASDKQLIRKTRRTIPWIIVPTQINAVVDSGIYFARNSRMRHILFSYRSHERDLKSEVPLELKSSYQKQSVS